jgi:hypothetical protein
MSSVRLRKYLIFILPFIFLLIFFVLQFIALRNHSQSFYFQDETEHVTLGWMMEEYGSALYKDLSTNHQPLPILTGAVFSKVINSQTLFQLIERLRIGMFLFNFLLSIFIVFRFRWKGLLSVLFLQSLAYLYFGWYVLAESLVTPFVSLIVLYLLEKLFEKKKSSISDLGVMSFSLFWVAFNLLPLWPFVGLVSLVYLFNLSFKDRKIFIGLIGFFTLLLFTQIPFFNWVEETFYHLVKYYLPYNQELGSFGVLQIILLPLTSVFYLQNEVARFLFFGLLLIIFLSRDTIKKRKDWLQLGLVIFLVIFLNNRVTDVKKVFFEGFHLYPFIGGFSALVSFVVIKGLSYKRIWRSLLVGLVVSFLILGNMGWFWESKDKVSEHNIQYGEQQAFASALEVLKDSEDRLLTGADGYGYINMVSGLPLADRQNFHLDWSYRVPKLRAEFKEMIINNPPEFIYFKTNSSDYYKELTLEDNYVELLRGDSSATNLYIHKTKAQSISENQWYDLIGQSFIKPVFID